MVMARRRVTRRKNNNDNNSNNKQPPPPPPPSSAKKEPWHGVCYFYQEGTCSKGKDCNFEHRKLSKKDLESFPKPQRRGSPSPPRSSSGGGGGGQPKAKAKGKAQSGGNRLQKLWCNAFLKGTCEKGDACCFPHLDEAAVNSIKAALEANKKANKGNEAAASPTVFAPTIIPDA